MSEVWQIVSWWCWRRWRIYCPCRDVSHLFNNPEQFQGSLFDYEEAFVSPCTLNPVWCGGIEGRWTPRIGLLHMEVQDG